MHKTKQITGFTKVPNSILNNIELSLEEKALLAILLSNASDWKIYITEIYSRSINGEPRQRKVFKALVQKGYVTQEKRKDEINKKFYWIYRIFPKGDAESGASPSVGNPPVDTPPTDSPQINNHHARNPSMQEADINKTDLNNTKEEKIKEIKKEIVEQEPIELNNENNSNTKIKSHTQELLDGDLFKRNYNKTEEDGDDLPF